jgi:phospholipid/cholesterol/gamma-HCH transport system substrate-binding protein
VVAGFTLIGGGGYQAKIIMPDAAELSSGSPVWINGRTVGTVDSLGVNNGQAVVTVSLDKDVAPLHDGTTSRVEWESAVGERVLTLYPGKESNAAIPSGGYLRGASAQVEVDQVLQILDGPTRAKLNTLIAETQAALSGHETATRQTLETAGAAANALGHVLARVGQDGPAIQAIVSQLDQLTAAAADRSSEVSDIVDRLDAVTASLSSEQQEVAATLHELPATLATAQQTLQKVPSAASAATGLLNALAPAASRLPSVSSNLAPVLQDVRPAVAQLLPLMQSARVLLQETPSTLDSSHAVVPGTGTLLNSLEPALAFLRPYTPDGVGGLTNWGEAYAAYDGSGHTWAGLLAPGVNALNESPVPLPTSRQANRTPAPGTAEGQPWTDATGSTIR